MERPVIPDFRRLKLTVMPAGRLAEIQFMVSVRKELRILPGADVGFGVHFAFPFVQISSRMLTKPHAKDKYILHLICEENHKIVKITGAAAVNYPSFWHLFTLLHTYVHQTKRILL